MHDWLARRQKALCLIVAGSFAVLFAAGSGNFLDGLLTSPYSGGFMFVASWVVLDFLIALCITRCERAAETPATLRRDRKSTRLNSSHIQKSRMPSSA